MAGEQLVAIGKMLADPTRSAILCALMGGRAHTGGELARHVGVSASTASEHLSKLIDAELVRVAAEGRHRYFRLTGPEVASMLETLGAAAVLESPQLESRAPSALRHARTCYDHLAGELAVRVYESLVARGHLLEHDDHVELTESGGEFLLALGVDVHAARATKRPTARACLDWTERRHHLAGSIGAELLDTFLANKWIARTKTPRQVRVTERGRTELFASFDLGDARMSA